MPGRTPIVRETVFEMFEDDTYTQNGLGWVSEVDGHCPYVSTLVGIYVLSSC